MDDALPKSDQISHDRPPYVVCMRDEYVRSKKLQEAKKIFDQMGNKWILKARAFF